MLLINQGFDKYSKGEIQMADNTSTGPSTSATGGGGGAGWTGTPDNGGLQTVGTKIGASAGAAAATATGLAHTAQEYAGKVSEAATQAKDYVSDKVSVVGEKIKEFGSKDLGELAENAKDFARKNPGQAILISAAAGLLLGLIVRGRR
jgi:ElaB/YqjD/DUF883 family membrane-anchored ribosome-binding protein